MSCLSRLDSSLLKQLSSFHSTNSQTHSFLCTTCKDVAKSRSKGNLTRCESSSTFLAPSCHPNHNYRLMTIYCLNTLSLLFAICRILFLGETFICHINLHNESGVECKNVVLKVSPLPLFHCLTSVLVQVYAAFRKTKSRQLTVLLFLKAFQLFLPM